MPISRDPRNDRRRRVLRDSQDLEATARSTGRARHSTEDDGEAEANLPRRSAGYSQDVRRACGQRLVQLIPVRRRSYLAVIFASCLVQAVLLSAHYMIYVSGSIPWQGHPLAIAFDASHPRSLAAWFSSQLWILCLGATVLTFQLRRHKLDDYNGEYRLWFWLVLTCLLGSLEASTGISNLFAIALDRWTQLNLGWSGPAVVKATMAVLVGMLGLRLCSELKTVPISVVFTLLGLVCWAGAVALGQAEFKLNVDVQTRIWLRASLWLCGLTAIWLAALSYLRSIYIEAQRRFLSRGRLAQSLNAPPLRQRLRDSMQSLPRFPGRRKFDEPDGELTGDRPGTSTRSNTATSRHKQARHDLNQLDPAATRSQENDSAESHRSRRRWTGWLRAPKDSDEPEEYRKVARSGSNEATADGSDESKSSRSRSQTTQSQQPAQQQRRPSNSPAHTDRDEAGHEATDSTADKRSWMPKFPAVKMPSLKVPRPKVPSLAKPKLSGLFSWMKLPSLPSLRLKPPQDDSADPPQSLRPVATSKPLPGTSASFDGGDDDSNRSLSKAERKRLRRMQRQQDRAA